MRTLGDLGALESFPPTGWENSWRRVSQSSHGGCGDDAEKKDEKKDTKAGASAAVRTTQPPLHGGRKHELCRGPVGLRDMEHTSIVWQLTVECA